MEDKKKKLQIRISERERIEIQEEAERWGSKMGVKGTMASYLLWLFRKYGKRY